MQGHHGVHHRTSPLHLLIAQRLQSPDDVLGRGLALVDSVVHNNSGTWGTKDAGIVWCQLALPEGVSR